MINPVIVIGLGNLLMSDEGIGVRVVQELSCRTPGLAGVDFADAGTAAMQVLHAIAGRRKVLLIDCAFMGQPPGTVRRFMPKDVRSRKAVTEFSLHEGDLLRTLELSWRLGEAPEDIVIFGVEPASVSPGLELSPPLAARLDEYVALVAGELGAASQQPVVDRSKRAQRVSQTACQVGPPAVAAGRNTC